jgi:glycosyltransferase involved in cell wall biosynthesis
MTKRSGTIVIDSANSKRKRIMFAVTTPFAVNSFLVPQLKSLSMCFDITLCVNLKLYQLSPEVEKFVEVVDIGFQRKIAPFRDLRALVYLYFVIRRRKPLAIHSITPKAGLLAMLAGFCARVPHRWHTFTGQVWVTKHSFIRCLLKVMDRLIVILSTSVFADSASQCRFLLDEGVVKSLDRISTIGPGSIAGVDTSRFHPDASVRNTIRQELSVEEDVCVFLFVGRLVRDKGVLDLLSAFDQLVERAPSVGLWIVGPDEENLMPHLTRKGLPVSKLTRWIGATSTPEKFMMAADVLVLPSYREGFGSVIIEAGSCALPVVGYKIDGVIDAVENGVSGVLVDVGEVESLAEQLFFLAGDHLKRHSMGCNAMERAANLFSVEVVSDAWLEHYRKLLMN